MSRTLFPIPEGETPPVTEPVRGGPARLLRADRRQVLLRPCGLESLLAEDHRARVVWEFITRLDLSGFHERIGSRQGSGGRPAFDPAVLLTLWVYATVEGMGSARLLERLCEEHDAYRGICGGLTINHHTLSAIRTQRAKEIDDLLTRVVATLMSAGVVTLECVDAIARNRGLTRFLVRGIGRCLAVLTLFALTHNAMRAIELMAGKN